MRETRSFRSATLPVCCGSLVLAALFVVTPGHAQQNDEQTRERDEQESAQQGEAAVQEEEGSIMEAEEIVVTARRREETLQDTPIAISPFSAEVLEARQIQGTQDLERIAPSLQFPPAGQLSGNTAASVVFIRGVGQLDPTAAVDPGSASIHEVYVGRAVGGLIDFAISPASKSSRAAGHALRAQHDGGAILLRTRTQFGVSSKVNCLGTTTSTTASWQPAAGERRRRGSRPPSDSAITERPFDGRDPAMTTATA
jgi:iron complex outermembrane receptor protein